MSDSLKAISNSGLNALNIYNYLALENNIPLIMFTLADIMYMYTKFVLIPLKFKHMYVSYTF